MRIRARLLSATLAFLLAGMAGVPSVAQAVNGWSGPTLINPNVGPRLVSKGPERGSLDSSGRISLYSLSCASPTFCVAVGGELEPLGQGPDPKEYERGYALAYDGSSWSSPVRVQGQLQLASVSCPSPSFCAAVGDRSTGLGSFAGYTLTYNGRSWSAPALRVEGSIERGERAAELESVSCASASFCVVTNNAGQVLLYNGSSWSEPVASDAKGRLVSLACPAVSFCVAIADVYRPEGEYKEGDEFEEAFAMTFNGSSWSAPSTLDVAGTVGSVSCSSASFCVALGDVDEGESVKGFGFALTFNGSSWSAPVSIVPLGGLGPLSCASSSFCVAVDEPEAVLSYNGSAWSALANIDPGVIAQGEELGALSCPSASFCLALDELGRAFFFPASAAPQHPSERRATLRVRPEAVHAGGRVLVSGSVGAIDGKLDCPVGEQVQLFSPAFTPSKSEFAGVPTVYGRVARNGTFSASARIPTHRRAGRYTISGRCGGGNLGVSAKLRVLP
jgi:hypothetical protein